MEKVKKEDLAALARGVLEQSLEKSRGTSHAALIALRGDLGAGKTTFTQALAKELGVTDTVQSPTYVLMRSYDINFGRFKKLMHIDAYRLENAKEFGALNPKMFLDDPHALVVIEWPERVEGALPTPDLVLNFSSQDAGERERYIEVV